MKSRKIRDTIISILLITSLILSVIIVSCSEDGGITTTSNTIAINNSYSEESIVTDAISATFEAVGKGAAKQTGEIGMGWVLGAMGLSSQSGVNWSKQLAIIDADLDSIISLLNEADDELSSIDSILNVINCTLEETSLQTDLAAIQTNYDTYNTLLLTASQGDTIPNSDMLSFSNTVINGNGSMPSIADALSNIQVNINEQSGVIVACMQPIPKPTVGFGRDTIYYAQAQSLVNKYYYYQTIGLGLLSEAYHYMAWVDAGSPGEKYTSADSVQLVCGANSQTEIDCNEVIVQMNVTYNSLLQQFKFVGDGYTDENLIFQLTSNGGIAWVRSLENFTQQSGADCTYPLTNTNLCGPTAGLYNQPLSFTTYYGTSGIHFADLTLLQSNLLGSASTVESFSTIGDYMESVGFQNMSNKILIADTLISLNPDAHNGNNNFVDTMHIVPFIDTDLGYFVDCDGNKKLMYASEPDFCKAMGNPGLKVEDDCDHANGYLYTITYKVTNTASGKWYYLSGTAKWCNKTTYTQPTTWTSTAYAPGWSFYQINSAPQKRFLLPVRTDFSGSFGCLSGYSNLNSDGVYTKCGADYQEYLNVNLPKPPTCSIANVNPPCN